MLPVSRSSGRAPGAMPHGSPGSGVLSAPALPMQNNIILQRHIELMEAYRRMLQEEECEGAAVRGCEAGEQQSCGLGADAPVDGRQVSW
jgi:hypothetical protein